MHFGVTLEQFGVTLEHFGFHCGSRWAYRRRMAGVMHIGAGLVGLQIENVHATAARSKFKTGRRTPTVQRSSRSGPLWGRFWGHFGHFGMTFRPLWVYDGYLGVIFVDCEKTFIFPTDLIILYSYLYSLELI